MGKVHSSKYKPWVYPFNGTGAPAEIDRVQSITPSPAPNREAANEVGADDDLVGYVKGLFEVETSVVQLENGSHDFWRKITNKEQATLTLDDFRVSAFDLEAVLHDDNGVHLGSLWYPELRTASFGINMSDPRAIIERNFSFAGNSVIRWQNDNKNVILHTRTITSGEAGDVVVNLTAKTPELDPNEPTETNADYFIRILRVRGSATTRLDLTTGYTYNTGTQDLTVKNCEADDVIKIYYTSQTASGLVWTPNRADPVALTGPYASVYLYIPSSNSPSGDDYLYRLQSANIEASLEREDLGELGTEDITDRGITDKTVTFSLSARNRGASIEQIFSGKGSSYGKIDFNEFSESLAVIVKLYKDSKKTQFAYGFQTTNLAVSGVGGGINVLEYLMRDGTLESKNLKITSDEGELAVA